MGAVLRVFTIAAFTATIHAQYLVFKDNNDFEDLHLTDPKSGSYKAHVINLHAEIELRRGTQNPDEIELVESSLLYKRSDVTGDKICKHYVGLSIKEKKAFAKYQIFCKLRKMTMKVLKNKSGKKFIEFTLFMDSDGGKQVALHVPVLEEPYPVCSANHKEIGHFLRKYNVLLTGPFDERKLRRDRYSGSVVIKFYWLAMLLTEGVKKMSTQNLTPETLNAMNYVTRPILLQRGELILYDDVINQK